MENNDSNPKPQKTGGLKLMTVFIGVLALHVVVIGGITVYHLVNGGNSDPDLVTDKTHKSVKVTPDGATVSDGLLPDGTADKSATASADNTGNPVTIPAPPTTSPTDATASTATPSPAPVTPVTPTPMASNPDANAPSGPIQSGPVITPPGSPAPASEVAAQQEATPAADSDATGGTPYVVKSHDSLARIAHQHHIKLAALRSANNLKSDLLQIGQKLTIPAKTQVAATTAPAASADSDHTNLSDSAPLKAKPVTSSSEPDRTLLGDSPVTSKAVSGSQHDNAMVSSGGSRHGYTVEKGDTLNKIARKFHTSPNAIMALNNITDARKLRLGQKLKMPSRESRSANSTPAATHPDQIQPRATASAQLANFIN